MELNPPRLQHQQQDDSYRQRSNDRGVGRIGCREMCAPLVCSLGQQAHPGEPEPREQTPSGARQWARGTHKDRERDEDNQAHLGEQTATGVPHTVNDD